MIADKATATVEITNLRGSELINTCENRQDTLRALSHNTTDTCHARPKGVRYAFGSRVCFACERFHKPVLSRAMGQDPSSEKSNQRKGPSPAVFAGAGFELAG